MARTRIAYDSLALQIAEMRGRGLRHKEIAREIGYSPHYITELLQRLGLPRRRISLNNGVDLKR